jgi:hypothetical protein
MFLSANGRLHAQMVFHNPVTRERYRDQLFEDWSTDNPRGDKMDYAHYCAMITTVRLACGLCVRG